MSYVVIEGLIGAGKTTLAKALEGLSSDNYAFYESVNNNIVIEDFYKDPKKHAFHMQIECLMQRYNQHKQALHLASLQKYDLVLTDRSILFDNVFAKLQLHNGDMTEKEYDTYYNLRNTMLAESRLPDLVVFLNCRPEVSMERIKQRSRNMESGIPLQYLKDLKACYRGELESLKPHCTIVEIDYENFRDEFEVNDIIQNYLQRKGGNYFGLTRPIGD